jgi:type I site-specific restriction endonuclease
MAWHMGHPLSQTLFTSVYLDKLLWPVPTTIDEARFYRLERQISVNAEEQCPLTHLVLRAFCLALVKACDLVHARVTAEYYYEVGPTCSLSCGTSLSDAVQEEDFVAQLYNRSLLTEFDIESLQKIISQAVAWLRKQNAAMDVNVKQALIDRLEFRKHFLTALDQDVDVVQTRQKGPFVSCMALVAPIEKSMSLGKPVPEAFSLKIQRRLASTVPPRPMVTISSKDAIDLLRRFCRDAIDMQEIVDYSSSYNLRVCTQLDIRDHG